MDFGAVFDAVPPVTRFQLLATAAVTLPVLLQLVHPAYVSSSWFRSVYHYEAWRPLTSFFQGGGGFPLLFDFFMTYRNSSMLERDVYQSRTSEYAWALLSMGSIIHVLNIPFDFPFLFRPMLHAQNYLYCRANPSTKVSLFGLLTIPTPLYPFALVILDLITGGLGKAISGLVGLMAGHIWWFISMYLPNHPSASVRRRNLLSAPAMFTRWFPPTANTGRSSTASWGGTRIAPVRGGMASGGTQATIRRSWGAGHRLGGS